MNPVLGLAKQTARVTGGKLLKNSTTARRAAATARALSAQRLLETSGAFDVAWYELQAGRRFPGVREAARHYVEEGRLAGLSPHPLYEPARRPDDDARRLAAGFVPFASFLRGARSPKARAHPLFDTRTWLAAHPKAAKHRFGAWGHFLQHAQDGTPLPLPAAVASAPTDGVTLTWGAWRAAATRSLGRWAEQHAVAAAPRVTPVHDEAADRLFREEVAGYPLPPADGPLVSIVTAVRNRPNQVLEAIASVQAQTLGAWEMIVVDDGSDDSTPEGVAEVARHDARVKLVRRGGEGVSRARNAGADAAAGRYVAWLDSDNTWAPDFLETAVRAMSGRGLRAAYASCEMITEDGTVYRDFAGGLEHLAVGNFVDLNVLVVERSLLAEAGGFDPGLPRAVDYDLVCRVAALADLGYLPFLAATYSDDLDDQQRISVKELRTWNYVVRERHVLDWDAIARDVPARVPGRVSLLVSGREEWRLLWGTVVSVLTDAEPGADLEIVVVDGASSRAPSLVVGGLAGLDPRVRVVRTPANYNTGGGRNVALAHSTGEVVVPVAAGLLASPGWLGTLLAALHRPGVVAATPLVTTWDGLIRSAGLLLPAWATLPVPFLNGHPVRDARGLGAEVEVPSAGVGALAVRAADAVAVRGFDPLYVDAYDDADLTLRLRALGGGACVLATGAHVVQLVQPEQRADDVSVQNRRLFAARWRTPEPQGDELWERAGFTLQGYQLRSPDNDDPDRPDFPHDTVVLAPLVSPLPGRGGVVTRGPAEVAGAVLRWVVEVPDLPTKLPQLDPFGEELAAALERTGHAVAVVRRTSARHRTPVHLDDVVVTIRGYRPAAPVGGRPNLLLTTPFGREPIPGETARFDALLDDPLDDADALAARLVAALHDLLGHTPDGTARPAAARSSVSSAAGGS